MGVVTPFGASPHCRVSSAPGSPAHTSSDACPVGGHANAPTGHRWANNHIPGTNFHRLQTFDIAHPPKAATGRGGLTNLVTRCKTNHQNTGGLGLRAAVRNACSGAETWPPRNGREGGSVASLSAGPLIKTRHGHTCIVALGNTMHWGPLQGGTHTLGLASHTLRRL